MRKSGGNLAAPFIIAELGTSHGGDIIKAKEMISAAADCGADCVKFQIVYADEILHPATGFVPLPGGMTALYEIFKNLEKDISFYAELKDYTEKNAGRVFLASVFGKKSAEELYALKPRFVKIASPELNYTELLETVGAWKIPVILSCGVSKLADIEAAVEILEARSLSRSEIHLLHCVTAYPAPPEDYNLSLLPHLAGIFGTGIGVSDHSSGELLVPLLALAKGASIIEKHFCLSKTGGGLDDPIALEPAGFELMCKELRGAASSNPPVIINYVTEKYGAAAVNSCLGDGVKRLSRQEAQNYGRTNRSVHALRGIEKGEIFTRENSAVLRTEKVLRPGLPPSFFAALQGCPANAGISAGQGIRLEDAVWARGHEQYEP